MARSADAWTMDPDRKTGDQGAIRRGLPIRHHEVAARLDELVRRSGGHIRILPYGASAEGRTLWRAIVSSPRNLARLDPDAGPGDAPVANVWMGYGIHGSELSPSDAAMRLIEWLGTTDTPAMDAIREVLVVHVDIMPNPDGRERSLSHLESWLGAVPNPDIQSSHNNVTWPKGRGNHYLFDLNRDALFCVQRESRLRVEAIRAASVHLYLDAHEMAVDDSFLFACPAEPFNPALPAAVHDSWGDLRPLIGAALDNAGVAHYTGAWNEVFFPGFFDIWPAYSGAVPILLEQATTFGNRVELPNGKSRDFSEAVDAQFEASRAMIEAAARDPGKFVSRWSAARSDRAPIRYWVVDETGPKRDRIAELLTVQGIAFQYLRDNVEADGLHSHWDACPMTLSLRAGALLVSTDQPLGRLVANLFDFHMPMDEGFLRQERARLDGNRKTQLYDCTAWALSYAYDARAFWSHAPVAGDWRADRALPESPATEPGRFGYRYDDPLLEISPGLMQQGLRLRIDPERGGAALLIRREDQDETGLAAYAAIAKRRDMQPLDRALADDGPDQGGDAFHLLRRPSVGILAGPGFDAPAVGALWHLFDERLGVPASLLDIGGLAEQDLRRYDVLIAAHGDADLTRLDLGWVENGGTLIALAGAARSLARSGRFAVTLDDDAVNDVRGDHALAIGEAARAFLPRDYPVWSGEPRTTQANRYLPRGCYVRADVQTGHWLTTGMAARVPILFREDGVLRLSGDAEILMRFAAPDALPLSGMIWPEAVGMIASTPCLVRERRGRGQIISFAWDPVFRGYSLGTQRLLLNAVYAGPAFVDRW